MEEWSVWIEACGDFTTMTTLRMSIKENKE